MDPTTRHSRLCRLFLRACDLPPSERAAFLNESCDDQHMRQEIDEMLARDERDAFVDQPVISPTLLSKISPSPAAPLPIPARIARYTILDVVGEGGMGTVYRAQQENPNRVVALKVIRPDLTSRELIRRFEHEAHILGRLRHPGIAKIYEAGTAETGRGIQPYFAMELIDGVPLLQYAANNDCDIRERLHIVAQICDAVHHAHQNGIVHRDIKPGNILVDRDGRPNVLDFGVARITDADIKATTINTGVGQLLGTIPYMSPEQIRGRPDEIDARSDVYAIGVVTYELLAGSLPHRLRDVSIPEAIRIIQDEEPSHLSTINRDYRGDIETIVAKALEKEPERRYQAASDMAGDIRRFLADQPIIARPPSAAYQVRKFARRNRALVTAVASIFIILLAALAVSITFAAVAAEQRNQAVALGNQLTQANTSLVEEAKKTKAINGFFNRMLETANPYGDSGESGQDFTVVDMLAHAARQLDDGFTEHPDVEAIARATIAKTYKGLHRFDEALHNYTIALQRNIEFHGRLHKLNGVVLRGMGVTNAYLGHVEIAESQLLEALELQRQLYEHQDHREIVTTLGNISWVLRLARRHDETGPYLQEAYEMSQRLPDFPLDEVVILQSNYAQQLRIEGNAEAALKLYREALEKFIDLYGPDHAYIATVKNNIALTLNQVGRPEEAVPLYLEAIEIFERSTEHNVSLGSMYNNLGSMYDHLERYDEGVAMYARAIEIYEKVLGSPHRDIISTLNNLGILLKRAGRYEEGRATYERSARQAHAVYGEDHWRYAYGEFLVGHLAFEAGDEDFGKAHMEQFAKLVLDHPDTVGWATTFVLKTMAEMSSGPGQETLADENTSTLGN